MWGGNMNGKNAASIGVQLWGHWIEADGEVQISSHLTLQIPAISFAL